MKFESAVQLKAAILKDIVGLEKDGGFSASAASADADPGDVSGRPLRRGGANWESRSRFQDGLAIGLASGKASEYRVAVLIQNETMRQDPVIDRILDMAKGEVVFDVIGRVRAATGWHLGLSDPLRIGASVAHRDVTAGSIGCFVRHRTTGKRGILSNNHVLANCNRGTIGDDILQPGSSDGGTSRDVIARLAGYVRIDFNGRNQMDAAWAEFTESGRVLDARAICDSSGQFHRPLVPAKPIPGFPDQDVRKVGRSTGLTLGSIEAVDVDNVVVDYDRKRARFDGQMIVHSRCLNPFAIRGDSGSLLVTKENIPVGLIFAVSPKGGMKNSGVTFATPLQPILDTLDLEIIPE